MARHVALVLTLTLLVGGVHDTDAMTEENQQPKELSIGGGESISKVQEAEILLEELEDLNIALGKATHQSSEEWGGSSSRAVDGDRSTNYGHNSCTHTHEENNPWWYVDLGRSFSVDHVGIVNRLDCCSERITPFHVHVGDNADMTRNDKCGGHRYFVPGHPEDVVNCNGRRGRYVGISLPGNHRILTLCEVEVYSAPNIALGGAAFQSSVGWSGYPARAVDGHRESNYDHHSCTATRTEDNPYWYVDLGRQKRVEWVVIRNRMDCCQERLNPFTIHIGNSPNVAQNPRCGGHHVIPAGKDKETISCNGMMGQYVGIRLPGNSRILTLCEVEVYESSGYKERTYDFQGGEGQGCGEHKEKESWLSVEEFQNCMCDLNEEVCNKVNCGKDGKTPPVKGTDGLWACPEVTEGSSIENSAREMWNEPLEAMILDDVKKA